MAMSTFARKICARYKADPPTLTIEQVQFYLSTNKITQAEYDCIVDPECSCDWSMATAAVAPEEAPTA